MVTAIRSITGGPEGTGQRLEPLQFCGREVGGGGDPTHHLGYCLHLDHDRGVTDLSKQVNLGPTDPSVPIHDGGPAPGQEVGSQLLADCAERRPP